ncbi:5-oxoprolinase subunit PxpB [Rhodanobacter sp. MP7CTX1]|jgi:KipI family sensor histidine kinase inhibitor|uniref:5-oxoprolinase subunit PxpB n=1 Tax=Rhodanobacter sp. MP7CTX1 TaxID=2723084 RepID=UPI00160795D8|nr:5-oxoprolinase subunit PxpB [Rhodanobacter sp. MP7CTX1]MBB6186695.1 KipI family sensor histidine kinase inhibitor [Rhodanobacter sp. MP7CTX1]
MEHEIQFEALAEDALLLRFGERIDVDLNAQVQAAAISLRSRIPELECVPAYASLLLRFDPWAWAGDDGQHPHQRLRAVVSATLRDRDQVTVASRELIIPVCYGGEYGPDLEEVAACCGLDVDTVIARHTAANYRVAMLGFAPGFPYLLGLDPQLAVPRRTDPRQRVPAGSVAIGGSQTGIYPEVLPGGWQLIGRTPLRLFDVTASDPSLLAAGDRVRFRAIDEETFRQLLAASPG